MVHSVDNRWMRGGPIAVSDEGVVSVGINPIESIVHDAFGRVRVSSPTVLFDSVNQYTTNHFWATKVVSGGSITHLPNESSVRMDVGTTSGDRVVRQSKKYFKYQAGKSQLIVMTGVFAPKTNVSQSMGYFDDKNGIFLNHNGVNLNIIKRSFITGSVVNITVPQSTWNIDKLDGTGKSSYEIDITKAQIFFIDLEWLGTGKVRCGFYINGVPYVAHQFSHFNELSTVYMTTANLPIRYEITNTGTTANATFLKQICASVVSEGGIDETSGHTHSANNGVTAIAVTTRRPVLSIRPKATFGGVTNRVIIEPLEHNILANDIDCLYEIVQGGALGAASFNSVDADSATEYDVSATTITGGHIIASGYVPATRNVSNIFHREYKAVRSITLDIDGANPENLTIVCTSKTGVASNILSSLTWKETA